VLVRTFQLRCRSFADFHLCCIFLAVFKILGQPYRCFGVLSLASSPSLAIVIRRLLYVPDYVAGSLNNSFVWSLSLQLIEYNSQQCPSLSTIRI